VSPVEEVLAEPVAVPAYVPMEPMLPAPAPPRYWCDFCKEFSLMPHTLEYTYLLPTPTPPSPTPMATGNGVPPLDPWFLATQAAPALDAVKVEEEEVVTGPGIGYLVNPGCTRAARTGVPPYYVMDIAGPSAPPPAAAPTPPSTTRAEAAARVKAQALPDPPPAETLPTPTLRRLLGRKTAAVDRRPGFRRTGAWNPADLGLPSAEVLNMAVGGGGFYSPDEGESSPN
jgi:hypothetical protein